MEASTSGRRPSVAGELTADERAAVVEVARVVGSLAERGPTAGQPSITALLRDIAAGAVTCRRSRRRGAARQTAAARIAELREREPGLTGAEVARRVGCRPQTVYAVWSRLRAATDPQV